MRQSQIKNMSGFTLIELMIVVAVIGVLTAVAIPKFGELIVKAKEATVKGQLGAMRSAISIYYADNEGIFPKDPYFTLTAGGRYLRGIPFVETPPVKSQGNPGVGSPGTELEFAL